MKPTDAITMTQYLLGQLPEAERDVCEQEWFVDKAKYAQLCEAENTLIDEYVRGSLRAEDRVLFEQHFLTIPARLKRLKIAEALVKELDHLVVETASVSWWERLLAGWRAPRLIPAIAILLLVTAGLALLWQRWQLREQVTKSEAVSAEQQRRLQELEQLLAAERAANSRLTAALARNNAQTAPPSTQPTVPLPTALVFALTAGVLRSENGTALPTLHLLPSTERVKLQVKLPPHNYRRLTATLRTAEGKDVRHWGVINPVRARSGALLTLDLSTKNLKAGDYVLVVSGSNASGEEEFSRLPFKIN